MRVCLGVELGANQAGLRASRRARADVFLEKPGAPTVGELEEMAAYAKSKGVGVFMGYNKNVTKCAHAFGPRVVRRDDSSRIDARGLLPSLASPAPGT